MDHTPFSINGKTAVFGIIGNPVSHSFSPHMHTTALQYLGVNAVYLPFPVNLEDLPNLLKSFDLIGLKGFNVTVPYKEEIIPHLDELDPAARRLGSVNTVLRSEEGWKGFSTDGSGFVRSLRENRFTFKSIKVLLSGAGGSAKAIALAIAKESISELHIQNRTTAKAEVLGNLVTDFDSSIIVKINPDQNEKYDLAINSTSVGMDGKSCPLSDTTIQNSNYLADIIYNPPITPLLSKAKSFNIPSINGIGMLLYQGVEAFEIWTGQPAPVKVMENSLKNSLKLN